MGRISNYIKENRTGQYANRMYGFTTLDECTECGVVSHNHDFKLDAGQGITTVGGNDSHAHLIVDGIIKPAANHTHKIDKLFNSKEEFIENLGAANPLKMYNMFNVG